jgi:hypothetical protein
MPVKMMPVKMTRPEEKTVAMTIRPAARLGARKKPARVGVPASKLPAEDPLHNNARVNTELLQSKGLSDSDSLSVPLTGRKRFGNTRLG